MPGSVSAGTRFSLPHGEATRSRCAPDLGSAPGPSSGSCPSKSRCGAQNCRPRTSSRGEHTRTQHTRQHMTTTHRAPPPFGDRRVCPCCGDRFAFSVAPIFLMSVRESGKIGPITFLFTFLDETVFDETATHAAHGPQHRPGRGDGTRLEVRSHIASARPLT